MKIIGLKDYECHGQFGIWDFRACPVSKLFRFVVSWKTEREIADIRVIHQLETSKFKLETRDFCAAPLPGVL